MTAKSTKTLFSQELMPMQQVFTKCSLNTSLALGRQDTQI